MILRIQERQEEYTIDLEDFISLNEDLSDDEIQAISDLDIGEEYLLPVHIDFHIITREG